MLNNAQKEFLKEKFNELLEKDFDSFFFHCYTSGYLKINPTFINGNHREDVSDTYDISEIKETVI